MSHIEKLEHVVGAGDKVVLEFVGAHVEGYLSAGDDIVAHVYNRYARVYVKEALNSRDSIAWALEVAKAAREFWDAADAADTEWDIPPSETNSHSRLYTARHALDTLLAKEPK